MADSALGRVYADGEVVVRQGEAGDCMFTIQDGQLEVLVNRDGQNEVRVGVMERGAIFGEMAIFEKEVRSATVRALGQARVLTIDKKTFLRRVQEDPSLAFNLVRMMSQRIRKLTTQAGERRAGSERRRSDRRAGGDRRGTSS
jgi:CRP-like cAMP-binding protein